MYRLELVKEEIELILDSVEHELVNELGRRELEKMQNYRNPYTEEILEKLKPLYQKIRNERGL